MSNAKFFDDVLHLLSPLQPLAPRITVDPDYIITTPVGCARIAYSPSTHCAALFYARPRGDLADKEKNGHIEINHKSYLRLLKVEEVANNDGAAWDRDDGRMQLDLSWVSPLLTGLIHDLPRIQMIEACLHRIAADTYDSKFLTYRILPPDENGECQIQIFRKSESDNEFQSLPDFEKHYNSGSEAEQFFRKAGFLITKPMLSHPITLHAKYEDADGKITRRGRFKPGEILRAIQADLHDRLKLIEDNQDPILWSEQKSWPFIHAQDSIVQKVEDLSHIADSSEQMERAVRDAIPVALDFFDNPVSAIGGLILDQFKMVGLREDMPIVPPQWEKLIQRYERRLVSIRSRLHQLLVRPDPNKFGDFEWLNCKKHQCNFMHDHPDGKVHPAEPFNPEEDFRNWFSSLFMAPYENIYEYIGDGGKFVYDIKDAKVMCGHVSNGVKLYYVPETHMLYGYYHHPDFAIIERGLHREAHNHFLENTVIAVNLYEPNSPLQTLSFADFQTEMKQVAGAAEMQFYPAHTCPPRTYPGNGVRIGSNAAHHRYRLHLGGALADVVDYVGHIPPGTDLIL